MPATFQFRVFNIPMTYANTSIDPTVHTLVCTYLCERTYIMDESYWLCDHASAAVAAAAATAVADAASLSNVQKYYYQK